MNELLDVLDENGIPTSIVKPRDLIHKEGDWHASIHLWLVNGRDVLVQKRSTTKESFPGFYDVSVAGHVETGEEYKEAALRECREETGVILNSGMVSYVGTFRLIIEDNTTGFTSREFNHVYWATVSKNVQVSPNEEIDSFKWVSIDDLVLNKYVETRGDLCIQDKELESILTALDC